MINIFLTIFHIELNRGVQIKYFIYDPVSVTEELRPFQVE